MAKRLNRDDVDKLHDYGVYIPTRTIYMGSESFTDEGDESGCDGNMAQRFIKNLLVLESISVDKITILCNNIGGDEYHGLAIYDAIRNCKSKVTIKVFGHAMSMGSIILQAADERIMMPNSRQMIHYGTWGYVGHAKTAQKWSQEGLKIDKWMERMYLEKIHQKHKDFTLDNLQKMLDHDTFLTAQESVKLGLADKVGNE
jgi:ATP-dependent Clp protease, protease subunit